MALLSMTREGLYCEAGGFHIDPWRPVARAVTTHAHSDHARPGSSAYLAATPGARILRKRLGEGIALQAVRYGETIRIGSTTVSLHPAGHLLGSSQVRIEHHGEVWVVTGDFKRHADPTCEPYEPLQCHGLVMECTFGLPVYRWRPDAEVFAGINEWWSRNADNGITSLLYGYALGKAQRLLAGLDPSIGPILVHGAVDSLLACYKEEGIPLPATLPATTDNAKAHKGKAIVIAPPSAAGTSWTRKFAPFSTAFASGWMQVRGMRRRRALDRGFVVSDHADWPALVATAKESGAQEIWATHGQTSAFSRYLSGLGITATPLETQFASTEEGD